MQTQNFLDYYKGHGIITDPGSWSYLLEQLPNNPSSLCENVHKLVLIDFLVNMGIIKLPAERCQETNIRKISDKIQRMIELDNKSFTEPRNFDKRLLGNCRDLSLMVCAALRSRGIPARVRSGFATFFDQKKLFDHWICEYWTSKEQRWIKIDAWMDQIQHEQALLPPELKAGLGNLKYCSLDVKKEHFITGGQAWLNCRKHDSDPDNFGTYGDLNGLWFIRDNMIRDLLCLNKIEVLPWDCWGIMSGKRIDPVGDELTVLDNIAEITQAGDSTLTESQILYETVEGLHIPPKFFHQD
ncbi:transglutaminase domain-containing protein [Methanosarcina sp.]|uniref:transglutaminase domain-containing protein n=1 Tax=Methanosarcina sp. TaxID=2213 RepID=UPI002988A5A2|nr:transglutaminase domain-containing protein [Methanosarcina sp.]MDW5550633.1 transglutaminase domain-containing protein [Methanosarcina sp.]MDW5552396.1 transglutaminase domain-containing protein [Methanosarcina sp.]MDW5560128.1 transglutaminase domain-containing protein [Methanosarcina sp.]